MATAYKTKGKIDAFTTGGAIRKYRIVKWSTAADNTILETDAEEVSCGISIDAAGTSGDVIKIQRDGIAKVEAGGSMTRGDWFNSDADGKAVTESTTNKWASGKVLQSADNGDIISVDLDMTGYISTT